MAAMLEGGCRVSQWDEGQPVEVGPLRVFPQIGRAVGAREISLRIFELAPGTSPAMCNARCDEMLYVVRGEGSILLDGFRHRVGPDTGFYVAPGSAFVVENPGPDRLLVVSSRCPEPDDVLAVNQALIPAVDPRPRPSVPPLARLADRRSESTADRWYRVLLDEEVGSSQVTQFVGGIPPGRAPDHFHLYEEVLFILAGMGKMWAGQSSTAIGPGSCVYLPRRQMHCVENSGPGELRLLGVFYPAGSPAVRYESLSAPPSSAAS